MAAGTRPAITVATGLWPLAQMASYISQGRARVLDVVPKGQDPQTYVLSAAQDAVVRRASVVLDIGGGFQPSFEKAAAGAPRVVSLLAAVGGTNPYVWLDPQLMVKASEAATAAFVRAEPAHKRLFDNGERDLRALLTSLATIYQDSLSDCPLSSFVTTNGAFSRLGSQYGIHDVALSGKAVPADPSAAQVARAAQQIRAVHARSVFVEPFQPAALARKAAAAAGVPVAVLDTLVGPPATGWPPKATYDQMMQNDVAVLARSLACSGSASS